MIYAVIIAVAAVLALVVVKARRQRPLASWQWIQLGVIAVLAIVGLALNYTRIHMWDDLDGADIFPPVR